MALLSRELDSIVTNVDLKEEIPGYQVNIDQDLEGISQHSAVRIPHNRSNYFVWEPTSMSILCESIPLRVIPNIFLSDRSISTF